MSSATDPREAVETARTAWQRADAQIPRIRAVHGDLSALHDAVARNEAGRANAGTVLAELDRLGGDSDDRRAALSFLIDPLFEGDRTLSEAFRHSRAITSDADTVTEALSSYVEGGSWSAVRTAVSEVVDPPDGPMAVDTTTLSQVVTLFGLAIEAGIAARERGADDLAAALADAYGTGTGEDPLADLEEQPIALLPVRLETRFVDEDRTTEGDLTDLLVRVYPDQVHVDSHEEQLTDDEVRWGQNFWATLWYARHPDPSKVPDDPGAEYLTKRLPNRRLRELVADIDPAKFSDTHHRRYRELKERAWRQLLDRFGRERAAYVVHALEPAGDDLAADLLTRPDPPPEVVLADPVISAEPLREEDLADEEEGSTAGRTETGGTATTLDEGTLAGEASDVQSMDVSDLGARKSDPSDQESQSGASGQSGTRGVSEEESGQGESWETLPPEVPALSFPEVPRRPSSWTQQPRAELLPDRWIAVAEWEDGAGEINRTAVAGAPIREPLPVAPSPESVAEEDLASGESESPAPERTEWMIDFDEAEAVGMGLRIHLPGLSGFDPTRGFTRLFVVGAKASLGADGTPEALVDLLDAHHYTDGLEFLEQGTPTNNHDDPSGYARGDDPSGSMDVECVPPLVESGDRSDGDLLARALAVDGEDHVFANVENADGTQQRDARHMNSALWPATLGYFFQDLLLDNEFTDNDSLWGGPARTLAGTERRDGLSKSMLWHDAYRRHFVRYVRGQGPFPAVRVGTQPYGILPAKATETDLDVTIVDHLQVARLHQGEIELADLEAQGTGASDLVDGGVSPATMLDAGADPDTLLDAGADPKKLVAGGADPASVVDPERMAPDALTGDGIGLLATSQVTKPRLEEAGVPVDDLEAAGVTTRDLARGDVTQEQLAEAGVTTEAVAEVLLPEEAKSLGITPAALERAGVTPAALVRGEVSAEQVEALGLSTRAVADAILPREARELGITPKKIEDAGISPQDLLNGRVDAADLEAAGISTEALAEVVLPQEVKEFGVTPERVGEAVSLADLFNGDVDVEDLEEAGLTTGNLADAALPQPFRDAGITPESLESAGITPAAVVNGQVTPEDVIEAGMTPEALAEAGVLPEALAEVGHAVDELLAAGLEPMELLERGLTPQSLLDAGVDPGLLVDAGLAPKKLVDAGVEAVELARMGATVADLAGGDVPAEELVKVGFTALDALEAGADALGVAQQGARPTELKDAGVDAGTLREAGKAAGSLRMAGYTAEELLESGYTAAELLNGGFPPRELAAAGVDPREVESAGRAVEDLLAAGHPPAELRANGYSARQLLDAGLDATALVAAGYTAGELADAGVPTGRLAEVGVGVDQLRAAGADTDSLAEAGVDPETLRGAGASAEELLDGGFEPEELLDAGFDSVELELAGVDIDQLAEGAAEGDLGADEVADAAVEGLQYAATVLEDPEQAERDLYSFSFDPAVPTFDAQRETPPGSRTGEGGGEDPEAGQTDGGVAAGIPVARPLSIDDRLPGDLESRIEGLGGRWGSAAAELPFAGGVDEVGLMDALKREGVSADLRQQTMAYSGEQIPHGDILNQLVRAGFAPGDSFKQLVGDLSANGDLDPRLGHFYTTDLTHEEAGTASAGGSDMPAQFTRFHLSYPKQGTIAPHEMVDDDIGAFVDALLDSTLSGVTKLSHRIEPDSLSLDTGVFDEETDWESLDVDEKRGRIVEGIEGADDPYAFASRLLGGSGAGPSGGGDTDAAGYSKIRQLGENQARHGDSGALRSLLRLLFQHGLLSEYVAARRRLGLAYDDLPAGWPDPAYYDGTTKGPLAPLLEDSVPMALTSHPNVGGMDSICRYATGTTLATNQPTDGDDSGYTYADALGDAAANYTSTTSIDPRLSEFTDSLRYLGGVEPDDLSRLAMETLDLASHRLDAWWTSLATKRLFELREAQGTYDSEAGFDHEKWSGGGSDVPRATVDPGLLSSMAAESDTSASDSDSSGQETTDSATDASDSAITGATTDVTGEVTETSTTGYDPAAIADVEIPPTDAADAEDDSGADGGMGPIDDTGVDPVSESVTGSDLGEALENVATREQLADPTRVHDRIQTDPGLYVGGYGFVENLAPDTDRDDPEYVHAPSEQHATTAALLRSGASAHDADEGENALSVDLSADRVRRGLRLIRGVRRGQSPGELLGYRFERRLHEETVTRGPDVNLMAYLDEFRAEFPAKHGKLKRPDERQDETKSGREDDLAARDALNGYQLVKSWDDYPFGRGELPGVGTTEYGVVDGIVTDLEDRIDAAGDLLTAESVHQLGQGNFERAGGSVGALARGEPLPDPQVARTPRSETGVTHRGCLLFGTPAASDDTTPRTAAEPVLATWVETLLPDHETVECRATYRWTETTTDPATGGEREIEHTAETTATLSDLELGPLDVLLLFGAGREETRSELEQRLAYRLLRERPSDPAVPDDAAVELALTETETAGATSMADLLELARSVREVVQSSRPVDATDLAHPTDRDGEGYDESTAETLTERADEAHDRLLAVARSIDERVAVLDADHAAGDGLADVPTPTTSADGGADRAGENADSGVSLPEDTAPASDPLAIEQPTVTEQVTGLAESIRAADEVVPLSTVESVASAIDAGAVRSELSALAETLPAGPADPNVVSEDVTVLSADGQRVSGTLGDPVSVPDVPADGRGDDTDDSGGETDESDRLTLQPARIQLDRSALGTTEPAEGTVEMESRAEIAASDQEWYVDETTLSRPGTGGYQLGDQGESAGEDESEDTDQQESASDDSGPDWSTETATVRVWGTDGLSWFEREGTVTPDSDGSFGVDFDFSEVSPGTPFQVVAVVDGTVAYSATGRVVVTGDASTSTQRTLEEECETLTRLLWLRKRRELFSVDSGPSAVLSRSLDRIEWDAVRTERNAVDPASSTVTQSDIDAVDALLDVEGLDPGSLAEDVDATVAPVSDLGLDTVVDVTGGNGGPGDANYWYGTTAGVGDVRARIERTLENPSLFNADTPPGLLAYHHDAAATLDGMADGGAVAAYLDAFLAGPAWTVRYLDRKVPEPATLVRDLTAWLYSPDDLTSAGDLATGLQDLAGAVSDLPALEALFEGLPADGATTRRGAFEGHLRALASELGTGPPALGDASTARADFDADRKQATTDIEDGAATERTTLSSVSEGAERSFRKIVLERLREPMTVAASYGVYGGTPESADDGRPEDEQKLLEQALALLRRLRSRLTEAAALDPRLGGELANRPVPQRIEDATDRLETLFGEGFTVLPPFSPTNPGELTSTFTDGGLVPDDRGMAAETWLQRAASFRDGIDDFREARSYAEAINGTLTPSLTVGQVPFEAGDTWVGVDGVEPAPGRLSLVAQFGPDASPATADGRLTGLFVDEWTESVPEDSETTGLALNYDEPGNRAPQSILLAMPEGDTWSLDELASVVAETAEYTRRRAVDLGDLDGVAGTFPGLYFAQQSDPKPSTPTVDFRMLDWYDRELVMKLQPPVVQMEFARDSGNGSENGTGNGNGGSS